MRKNCQRITLTLTEQIDCIAGEMILEERGHSMFNEALHNGTTTMQEAEEATRVWSQQEGQENFSIDEEGLSQEERSVRIEEAVADMVRAKLFGNAEQLETLGKLPSGIRAFIAKMKAWFTEVLRSASIMKRLEAENAFSEGWQRFLSDSVGLTEKHSVESGIAKQISEEGIVEGVSQVTTDAETGERLIDGVPESNIPFSIGKPRVTQANEAQAMRDAVKDFERELSKPQQELLRQVAAVQFARVEKENAEILRAHDEEGKPLPAPNGKPSKLNRRQWIQVRTPLFKRWFGDWETLARINHVKTLTPIDSTNTTAVDGKDEAKKVLQSFGDKTTNKIDGRTVRFPSAVAGKILRHKGFETEKIIRDFKKIFEASVPAWIEKETAKEGHKKHTNIAAYHNYVGKFRLGEKSYFVRFTVTEAKQQNKTGERLVHSSFVSDVSIYEQEKSNDSTSTLPVMDRTRSLSLLDKKLLAWFESVNPDSVSKVIDENGEPMRVYHGGTVGNVFSTDFSGSGGGRESAFFFTPDIRQAKDYAGTGSVKEVFINLRTPVETDVQLESDEIVQAKADGKDGYWIIEDGLVDESEIAVFSSTQIKSATGNQGTFTESGNIRFSIGKQRLQIKEAIKLGNKGEVVVLPSLSDSVLNIIGKSKKPLRLKPNIVEKNKIHHPELSESETHNVLSNALYLARVAIQTKPKTNPDYWLLSAKESERTDNAVVELSETKDAFEVIGWYQMREKSIKQKERKAKQEGGQVLIISQGVTEGLSEGSLSQEQSSQRLGTVNPDSSISFSLSSQSFLERAQALVDARKIPPKVEYYERASKKLTDLKKRLLKRNAGRREFLSDTEMRKFKEEELYDRKMAKHEKTLYYLGMSEEMRDMRNLPVTFALLENVGKLESKSSMRKRRGRANDSLYDDAPYLPGYVWGGRVSPDAAANELYDMGILKENSVDALWKALEEEYSTTKGWKERYGKASMSQSHIKPREDAHGFCFQCSYIINHCSS